MESKTGLLEFAVTLEQKSIDYYNSLSRQTIVKELSSVFQFLAGEENIHLSIMLAWRDNADVPVLEDAPALPDPETVFPKLAEHFMVYGIPATHYYNAYDKARIFEEKSVAFYESLLGRIEEGKKDLLLKIIDQEKHHAEFFTKMQEFLRRPGEWLENAEWYHLEEY